MMGRAFKNMLMLGSLWSFPAWADWPDVPYPWDAKVESIGEQVRLNGVPMRMRQVIFKQSVQETVRFYRERLGPKLAKDKLPGGERILAQGRGDYFITLRIRPTSGNTSMALVSVSDMRAAREASGRPLGFILPADSRVLSDMESTDAGKQSRHLVFQNRLDIDTNRTSLARELQARGFRPDAIPSPKNPDAEVLYFQGDKREAQLTLVRRDGLTQAVLTTIRTP